MVLCVRERYEVFLMLDRLICRFKKMHGVYIDGYYLYQSVRAFCLFSVFNSTFHFKMDKEAYIGSGWC